MSSHIFFKDGGAGLSFVKSMFAGGVIVAAAAGDGGVSDASAAGDGSVAADAGDGSTVGRTGVSGGLGTGEDVTLRL